MFWSKHCPRPIWTRTWNWKLYRKCSGSHRWGGNLWNIPSTPFLLSPSLTAGSATDYVLQEPGPGGALVGLRWEADRDDPEYYRICEAYTRIHAPQPRRPGEFVNCFLCIWRFAFCSTNHAFYIPSSSWSDHLKTTTTIVIKNSTIRFPLLCPAPDTFLLTLLPFIYLATAFKILCLTSSVSKILLLKTGSFELAIVRMSRLMDLSQNAVLYGDVMLPQEAFYTSDSVEMKLVAFIFETAKNIAELKLTETELALYQSLVLLWPGEYSRAIFQAVWRSRTNNGRSVDFAERNGVRGNTEIQRLFNMSMSAIKQELESNHLPLKGDVTVLDTLLNKIPTYRWVKAFLVLFDLPNFFWRILPRELSLMHMEALSKFKQEHPHYVFPALYKELFSIDSPQDLT